ncbi:MAG: GPR endopeptidase [Lachnospiraceae bacterium]|nr:GPR endopeptidase [Lachnospiraceae bacterium]
MEISGFDFDRTDLALENREKFEKDNVEIDGVEVVKHGYYDRKINIVKVIIKTEEAAKVMGKPIGTYTTIESEIPYEDTLNDIDFIAGIIAGEMKDMYTFKPGSSFLVAGLGNRDITADSLGPNVAELIDIDMDANVKPYVVIPGVMAKSGMESALIVKGVSDQVKPDVIIAIDSLAARNIKRLNRVIQIANTGINPGSGVDNHRYGINEESMGVPVIAIGVPMVVNAATIVRDALESIINDDKADYHQMISDGSIIENDVFNMFVTSDCIDENIYVMAKIIAKGLNKLVQERL